MLPGIFRAACSSDCFDLDGIGIAAASVDGAAGEDNVVTGLQIQHLSSCLLGIVEHNVHAGELFCHNGGNAPAHGQTAPDFPVGGHADDVHRSTETAHQHGGLAGNGANHNGLGIHIQCHGADSVGNAVQIVLADVFGGAEALDIVRMMLGVFGNLCHGLHSLHRILTGSGFTGQHDAGGTVVNGVGNVGDFRTGGTGVLDHGFQHFGGGDNTLAHHTADTGQLLLDSGNLHKGNLHAQITAGNHDAAAVFADFHHIVHTGLVFDLGNDLDIAAAVLVQELTDILNVLGSGNKGGRHKVHTVLDTENDVFLILLGKVRTGHDLVGEGHALAVAEDTALEALCDDIIAHDFFHLELHHTVIDGQHIAGL